MKSTENIYTTTYSGLIIDLNDFTTSDINLIDIAVSLSRQRRYAGHTAVPWTVGQHSILNGMMAQLMEVSENDMKAIVLHDAAETYIQDVVNPIKRNFMLNKYRKLDKVITSAIFNYFEIEYDSDLKHMIECFDQASYVIEAFHMIPRFVYDQNKFDNDTNALIMKFINDDFQIPEELIEMSDNDVAQNLHELMAVWVFETTEGQNVIADRQMAIAQQKVELLKD